MLPSGSHLPEFGAQHTHRSPHLLCCADPAVVATQPLPSISPSRTPQSHREQCLRVAPTRSGFRRRSPPSLDTLAYIPTLLGFSVSGVRFRTHVAYVRFSVAAFKNLGDRISSGSWSRASQTTGTWRWPTPAKLTSTRATRRANLRINDYPGDLHEAPSHAVPIRPLQPVQGPQPDREKPREKTKDKRERRDKSPAPQAATRARSPAPQAATASTSSGHRHRHRSRTPKRKVRVQSEPPARQAPSAPRGQSSRKRSATTQQSQSDAKRRHKSKTPSPSRHSQSDTSPEAEEEEAPASPEHSQHSDTELDRTIAKANRCLESLLSELRALPPDQQRGVTLQAVGALQELLR